MATLNVILLGLAALALLEVGMSMLAETLGAEAEDAIVSTPIAEPSGTVSTIPRDFSRR